ncbi:hypothetical protein Bca101_082341 [Brassica carinata]
MWVLRLKGDYCPCGVGCGFHLIYSYAFMDSSHLPDYMGLAPSDSFRYRGDLLLLGGFITRLSMVARDPAFPGVLDLFLLAGV